MTRISWRGVLGCLVLSLALSDAGCGDGGGSDDAGGDGAGDAAADSRGEAFDADLPSNMGAACAQAGQCEAGSPLCLVFDVPHSRGVCTDSCKPDDPGSPRFNEDDCPVGFACAALSEEGSFCLKTCRPSLTENPCPADVGQICAPESAALLPTGRRPVCWFTPCESGRSCPVLSDKSCEGEDECGYVGEGAFCEPNEKLCALPGNCTVAGICGPHDKGTETAQPGDPCVSDFECPHAGFCIPESESEGGVVTARNGYCTIANCAFADDLPGFECGPDATCDFSRLVGLCFETCDLEEVEDCRGVEEDKGGDYECYSMAGYTARDGMPVASKPLCIGARFCLDANAKDGCPAMGLSDNKTEMKCRDRATGIVKDDPDAPEGVCLDNTASGEFDPAPDGGTGDDAT